MQTEISDKDIRPNQSEIEFLNLAYNRFYDLFEEIMSDAFWSKEDWSRFTKIRDGFCIYTEIMVYEPIARVIENMRRTRPPMEAEISDEVFGFVRNVLVHFPLFESWNNVWINENIVNWHVERRSIDRFLRKYVGRKEIKYRFWRKDKNEMTYLNIKFPLTYNESKIYLKDIITEKEGVQFSYILMKKIIDTQVDK